MCSGVAHFKNPTCWKSKKKQETINQQHGQQCRWTVDPDRCAGPTQPVGLPHFGWEHLDRMDWRSQVRHHVPRQRYIHGGFRTFKFRQGRFHVWRRSFLDCRLCQKDKPQVKSASVHRVLNSPLHVSQHIQICCFYLQMPALNPESNQMVLIHQPRPMLA